MLAHERLRLFRLSCSHKFVDPLVLVPRGSVTSEREPVVGAVKPLHAPPNLLKNVAENRAHGEIREPLVHAKIGLGDSRTLAVREGLIPLREGLLNFRAQTARTFHMGGAGGGKLGKIGGSIMHEGGLERDAQVKQLARVIKGWVGHAGSDVCPRLHETFGCENAQRLTDGNAGELELLCERYLAKRRASLILGGNNSLTESGGHGLRRGVRHA